MQMPFNYTVIPLLVSMPLLLLLTGCPQDSKPDIEAGTLSVQPAAPTPTVPGVVSLPVTNSGDKNAGTFAWTVRRDGAYDFATGTVPGLAEGASTTISFTVLEPIASTHTYQVILNSNNDFEESDLENNTATAAIGFSPTAVDPQVTSLLVTTPLTGEPRSTDPVALTATVISPLTALNTVTDLQWTLTGRAVLKSDPLQVDPTPTKSGVIASLVPGATESPIIVVGPLDPLHEYTYTFTISTGITNTDTDTINNAASTALISPTPSARAAILSRPDLHSPHLSQRYLSQRYLSQR